MVDRQEENSIAHNAIKTIIMAYKDKYDSLPADLESRVFASVMNSLIIGRSMNAATQIGDIKSVAVEVAKGLMKHIAYLLDGQPIIGNKTKREMLKLMVEGHDAMTQEKEQKDNDNPFGLDLDLNVN